MPYLLNTLCNPMLKTVQDLAIVKLPHHFEDNGDLIVIEKSINVPFNIARVFVVRAPQSAIRGQHAHRKCSQFLTCPNGIVEVICKDGIKTKKFMLNHPNTGLLIPPGIWAQQKYMTYGAVLTVLCDQIYDAKDYIREYADFKRFRLGEL